MGAGGRDLPASPAGARAPGVPAASPAEEEALEQALRERPLDRERPLPLLRGLKDVLDKDARKALQAQSQRPPGGRGGRRRGGPEGPLRDLPVPRVAAVAEEEGPAPGAFARGDAYLKRGQGGPMVGTGYDLDEEDLAWLRQARPRKREAGEAGAPLGEASLEALFVRLDLALHAAVRAGVCPSEHALLPWESAQEALVGDPFDAVLPSDLLGGYEFWVAKRKRRGSALVPALQAPPGRDPGNPYDLFCGDKLAGVRGPDGRSPGGRAAYLKGVKKRKTVVLTMAPLELPPVAELKVAEEHAAAPLPVVCGRLRGHLLHGFKAKEERIRHGAQVIAPSEFERRAGRGSTKKWKCSCKVDAGAGGLSVGDWLRRKGEERGQGFVGALVAVNWPDDDAYYAGVVNDFGPADGQHHIRYVDGDQEWLHLSMQNFRVLEGRAADYGIATRQQAAVETTVVEEVPARLRAPAPAAVAPAFPPAAPLPPADASKAIEWLVGGVGGWIGKVVAAAKARLSPASKQALELRAAAGPGPVPPAGGPAARQGLDFGGGPARWDADMTGAERPELIRVACGHQHGTLLPGKRARQERVLVDGAEIPPSVFMERNSSKKKKWKELLRVQVAGAVGPGPTVGEWLRARGHERGRAVVSERLGIFWPDDQQFYWGTVCDFNFETGEHFVHYDDGQQEWLYLSLQTVKWKKEVVEGGAEAGAAGAPQPMDLL